MFLNSKRLLCILTILVSGSFFTIDAFAIDAPPILQPSDLVAGETFFVMFVSDQASDFCSEIDPAVIDTFAVNAAAAGARTNLVTDWKALYIFQNGGGTTTSTIDVGAAWAGVIDRPVYTTLGTRIANTRSDLFDGTSNGYTLAGTDLLVAPERNENGENSGSSGPVYTGFNEIGGAADSNGDGTGTSATLGSGPGSACRAGLNGAVDRDWANASNLNSAAHIYVLSPLLTMPVLNNTPTVSGVTLSGTTTVGEQLAGSYTYADTESDVEGTSTFRWVRHSLNTGVSGGTEVGSSQNYTLVSADVNQYLYFCATPAAATGTVTGTEVCSSASGQIQNSPPVFAQPVIVITGAIPIADAGSDIAFDSTGNSIDVQLDGSGSHDDEDGTSLSYNWYEGNRKIATGVSPIVNLDNAMVHKIALRVIDSDGNDDYDRVDVVLRKKLVILDPWELYASVTTLPVTSKIYLNGYRSRWIRDAIEPCYKYDQYRPDEMMVRVTMGDYVDYFKLTTDLCGLLNGVGRWYWHSYSESGPWKLVSGNHKALLLGFKPYGPDDTREWGPFIGAPDGPAGYTAKGGGCCHASLTSPLVSFWRSFTIHVKYPGSSFDSGLVAYAPQQFVPPVIPPVSQQSLAGIIRTDGTVTDAGISVGASSDGGQSSADSFNTDDVITLTTIIYPDSDDIGEVGEIYVVLQTELAGKETFVALDAAGQWQTWDTRLSTLPAAKFVRSLEAVEELLIYAGQMSAGERRMYVGYSLVTNANKPVINANGKPFRFEVLDNQ